MIRPSDRYRRLTGALLLTGLLLQGASALAEPPLTKAEIARQKAEQLEQRVVETDKIEPAPDAARLTPAGTEAVDPRGLAPLDDAITCLARSIYWEAKGTDQREMQAVANVIMNRLGNPEFPSSLCDIVQQGSETGQCQFSWWCDGRPDEATEPEQYAAARDVARRALNGTLPDITHGALFFHHRSISPGWMSTLERTARTHEFNFYREPG
jgi:hypothetical protein